MITETKSVVQFSILVFALLSCCITYGDAGTKDSRSNVGNTLTQQARTESGSVTRIRRYGNYGNGGNSYAQSTKMNNYGGGKTNSIKMNAPVFCPPRYPTTAFEFILNKPGDKPKYNDPNKPPVVPTNLNSNLPERYDGPAVSHTGFEASSESGTTFNAPIHGGMGLAGPALSSNDVRISGRRRRKRTTFNAPVSCS